MIKAFLDAIKIKDIKNRLLFTLFILIVVRLGSNIPVIGIDRVLLKEFFDNNLGEASNFLNAMTGGSLTQMTIFALNVGPYITSSIIIIHHLSAFSQTKSKKSTVLLFIQSIKSIS